ncbi:MAG TPA: PqiC family protein [Stellaceae bacterium]|nr:PqiC family protein [Stellaceae bacterium]
MRRYSLAILVGSMLLAPLAGCGNDKPTHLYVLTATAEKTRPPSPTGLALGIGPITLPKYIDRPQVVSRIAANSLDQSAFEQWGGDLNDNITRVLADNLGSLLATDRVSLYPWKGAAPIDYQVTMDVTRFEQDADGNVVLDTFWSITSPGKDKALTMRRNIYSQPAPSAAGGGRDAYDAMVAAMNADLLALSRDIASALTSLGKP